MTTIYLSMESLNILRAEVDVLGPLQLHRTRIATDVCRHTNAWALTLPIARDPISYFYDLRHDFTLSHRSVAGIFSVALCSKLSSRSLSRASLLCGARTFLSLVHSNITKAYRQETFLLWL